MPPHTPPPFRSKILLSDTEKQHGTFQISQSGFPFSSIPSNANKALWDPCKSGCSCLQREQSQPSGCKAPQDCLQNCGCAFPQLMGTGTAMRCKAPFKTALSTMTPVSPVGRADVAERMVSWDCLSGGGCPFPLTHSN